MRRAWLQVWMLALAATLIVGCGGSGEKAEDAAKKLEQASDKLAKGQGSPEDLASAMKDMSAALSGGRKVEPLSAADLKAMLPDSLPGMNRQEASGEKSSAFGLSVSETHGRYQSADGEKDITLRIQDMGNLAGPVAMAAAAWAFTDFNRETDTGYEKTTTFSTYKAHERYDRSSKNGTINVLIASRFIVTAEGSQISINELQAALGKLDLAKLEARKDEGVQR